MTKRIEGAPRPISTEFFGSVQSFVKELFPAGVAIIRTGVDGLGYRVDTSSHPDFADEEQKRGLFEGIDRLSREFLPPGWEVREGKAGFGVDINPPR